MGNTRLRDVKTEQIVTKVTPGFKLKIESRASELEMNASEYIRYLIQKDLENNK